MNQRSIPVFSKSNPNDADTFMILFVKSNSPEGWALKIFSTRFGLFLNLVPTYDG